MADIDKLSEDNLKQLVDSLKINRDLLDEELISQPHTFFHVAERYALAISRRDKSKQDLEILEATLDSEIRRMKFVSGEKVTEKLIDSSIKLDPNYIEACDRYQEFRLIADKWSALKESWQQRSYALKDLVALHSAGYFGEIIGASERRDAHERFTNRKD